MDDKFRTNTIAHRDRARRGFTLVEMLVVIAIIGVLASLIMAVGGSAIRQAKRTTIKMDISQLESAIIAYKEKYGDYPPDFAQIGADIEHRERSKHCRLYSMPPPKE